METTKIHVTNMNLHYGDFHALKNINIDIPENTNYIISWIPEKTNKK